ADLSLQIDPGPTHRATGHRADSAAGPRSAGAGTAVDDGAAAGRRPRGRVGRGACRLGARSAAWPERSPQVAGRSRLGPFQQWSGDTLGPAASTTGSARAALGALAGTEGGAA